MRATGRSIVAASAFLLMAAGPASKPPPWMAELGYLPDEVFPIEIGDHRFPLIGVTVDNRQFKLLFDTGNMVGLSLPAPALRQLALARTGDWTSLGSDGSVKSVLGVFRASTVSVFGQPLSDTTIYELEDSGLPGLLGPQFLRDRRFTLDYERRLLAVTARDGSPCSHPGAVPLVRSLRHPDLILARGSLAGKEVLLQLDTGKSRSTVDPELAARLGLRSTRQGILLQPLVVGSTSLRPDPGKPVRLAEIDPDLQPPIAVGVGSDALRHVILTVDPRAGCLLIQSQPR